MAAVTLSRQEQLEIYVSSYNLEIASDEAGNVTIMVGCANGERREIQLDVVRDSTPTPPENMIPLDGNLTLKRLATYLTDAVLTKDTLLRMAVFETDEDTGARSIREIREDSARVIMREFNSNRDMWSITTGVYVVIVESPTP
jgi:hypothetical protein